MWTVDLRQMLPPVRSQRGLHSCMALAISDAIWCEFNRCPSMLGGEDPFIPSAMFIYYNARKRAGHENHNIEVSPSDAIAAVNQLGVCSDEAWPYHPGRYRERPPTRAYDLAQEYTGISFEELRQDADVLEASLAAGIPFLFCLRLFSSNCRSFDRGETASTGCIEMPQDTDWLVRNHAMLAVGYDDRAGNFLARNSFGDEWGLAGHVSVPRDYLLHLAKAYAFWRIEQRAVAD